MEVKQQASDPETSSNLLECDHNNRNYVFSVTSAFSKHGVWGKWDFNDAVRCDCCCCVFPDQQHSFICCLVFTVPRAALPSSPPCLCGSVTGFGLSSSQGIYESAALSAEGRLCMELHHTRTEFSSDWTALKFTLRWEEKQPMLLRKNETDLISVPWDEKHF